MKKRSIVLFVMTFISILLLLISCTVNDNVQDGGNGEDENPNEQFEDNFDNIEIRDNIAELDNEALKEIAENYFFVYGFDKNIEAEESILYEDAFHFMSYPGLFNMKISGGGKREELSQFTQDEYSYTIPAKIVDEFLEKKFNTEIYRGDIEEYDSATDSYTFDALHSGFYYGISIEHVSVDNSKVSFATISTLDPAVQAEPVISYRTEWIISYIDGEYKYESVKTQEYDLLGALESALDDKITDNELSQYTYITDLCAYEDKFGFESPAEISSNSLFYFVRKEESSFYSDADGAYKVPLSHITEVLDSFFVEYNFDPNEVTIAEYNEDSGEFTYDSWMASVMWNYAIRDSEKYRYLGLDLFEVEVATDYGAYAYVVQFSGDDIKYISLADVPSEREKAAQNAVVSSGDLAGAYLKETSDRDIFLHFVLTSLLINDFGDDDFSSPSEISSSALFNLVECLEYDYIEENFETLSGQTGEFARMAQYTVPIEFIESTLDNYFDGYNFNPRETAFGTYDEEKDAVIANLHYLSKHSSSQLLSAKNLGDNFIEVRLIETFYDRELIKEVVIRAQVTHDAVKFISMQATEIDENPLLNSDFS